MSEIIIFENLEGGIGIMIPAPDVLVSETKMIKVDEVYDDVDQAGIVTKRNRVVEKENIIIRPITTDEIARKDLPESTPYFVLEDGELPLDVDGKKLFRDAWVCDIRKKTVTVDMSKAREIHLADIRQARNKKFVELGFPFKLDEDLEEAIIPEEKRAILYALRDITDNIDLDAAKTPEDLRAIWPEILN